MGLEDDVSYFEERMAEIDAMRQPDGRVRSIQRKPKDEGRWRRWSSWGPQPVPDDVAVEVRLRKNKYMTGTAGQLGRKYQGKEIAWRWVGDGHDIIAYRLLAPSIPPHTPLE